MSNREATGSSSGENIAILGYHTVGLIASILVFPRLSFFLALKHASMIGLLTSPA